MANTLNKFAASLISEARCWAQAATLLENDLPKQTNFSIARSIEQSLKGVLCASGASEQQLLDLGHDLCKAWDSVRHRTDVGEEIEPFMAPLLELLPELSDHTSWAYGNDRSEWLKLPLGRGHQAMDLADAAQRAVSRSC